MTGILKKLPVVIQLLIAGIVPVLLALALQKKEAAGILGLFSGINIGIILMNLFSRFMIPASILKKIICYLIGIAGIFLFYPGLKMIFPDEGESFYLVFRYIRYGVTGLWITFIAPFLFNTFKLSSPE